MPLMLKLFYVCNNIFQKSIGKRNKSDHNFKLMHFFLNDRVIIRR